uniref:Uncharacterized protein n=1 Tax=Arundo donax TaxID=35708 RepID=A0A0A9C882_ARUDO
MKQVCNYVRTLRNHVSNDFFYSSPTSKCKLFEMI